LLLLQRNDKIRQEKGEFTIKNNKSKKSYQSSHKHELNTSNQEKILEQKHKDMIFIEESVANYLSPKRQHELALSFVNSFYNTSVCVCVYVPASC
jgi:hypothetical protein